jgi:glycosyltransferase involved in cell wall biosynthesis
MQPSDPPLVSVLLAAHDAEQHLEGAVRSVLAQTLKDLELVVVDDGSRDRTPQILEQIGDPRLLVLRNDERRGLAAALNRGLDHARGRYVARLDADDLAFPCRLAQQVERIRSGRLGIVGSAVLDIDEEGEPGAVHEMPLDPVAVRWHALFSSPFYHPTVLVDRELLDRHGLRYDASLEESEDYDLWTRFLAYADGVNIGLPLVLYRVHAAQATQRRRPLQRAFQQEIALRQIAELAPELPAEAAELAWRFGVGEQVDVEGADAFLGLLEAFRRRHGQRSSDVAAAAAARLLVRNALRTDARTSARLLRSALELRPVLPLEAAARIVRRPSRARAARRAAPAARARTRVAVVAPEPTPYRAPVFDLLAERPELDLTVIYSGRSLMWRTWRVEPRHCARFLRGFRVPGARRLVHHEFPVTPGIFGTLEKARPDVVAVVGWSTFASQAALAWCRARHVPYILEVDSHDEGDRAGWRRAVKGLVVPSLFRGASGVLAAGELARRSVVARGADPARVRRFAVTIDAPEFRCRAQALAPRRSELRGELGLAEGDVAVLSAGRLAPEKGLDVLVRAVAAARDPALALVIAGRGPEEARLEALARSLGVRLLLLGDRPWERMTETYVAADVFALLSHQEPWGVVVNEAAACGLPLLLSDRVGAAHDLLCDGENGFLVPAGDVERAADALRRLAHDAELRAAAGASSQQIMESWGYEPSVDSFLAAVAEAIDR